MYNPNLISAPNNISPTTPFPSIWMITPQMFGAVGDGVADDTVAIQNWLTALGSGYYENTIIGTRAGFLPAGKYKVTANLTVPTLTSIYGVKFCSVIQPTSAVSGICFKQTPGTTVEGITVDGVNAAAGVIGWGDDSASNSNSIVTKDCSVVRFTGTASVGLRIINAEHWLFESFTADTNYDNIHIGLSGVSAINVLTFIKCLSKSAVRRGLWGEYGSEVEFYSFESVGNGTHGVYLYDTTGSGALNDWRFYALHTENNWQSLASGVLRHAQYSTYVQACTGFVLRDSQDFVNPALVATEARSLQIVNSRSYILDNFVVPNFAGSIQLVGTARGSTVNWPELNGSVYTTIDNSGLVPFLQTSVGLGYQTKTLTVTPLTYAALPAAVDYEGMMAYITDSNTAVFNATAAGGGANRVGVRSNGTNWVVC